MIGRTMAALGLFLLIAPAALGGGIRCDRVGADQKANCERTSQRIYVLARDDKAVRTCKPGRVTCAMMDSCADAIFHLTQCGQTQLDRDRDGVPCESICR